jgi:hypothetical protein
MDCAKEFNEVNTEPPELIQVPRYLTSDLWMAAQEAKVNGTNCTLADFIDGLSQQDCKDFGIPWPDLAYDRTHTINEDVRQLLIRTIWNAIIAKIESTKKAV